MSTQLQKRGPVDLVPGYLLDDADTLKQVGSIDFTGDDFVLPRLAICQDLTPHRKKNIMGQPNERYIEGLEPGQLFVGASKNIYGDRVKFVVLDYFRSNRYFDGQGGIKCRADNGRGCSLNNGGPCCNNEWDNTKTGKDAQPKCTELFNYVVRILDSGEYAVLSFKSTGIKVAKEFLNGQLRDSVQPGVALYRKVFELSAKPEKNAANQEYFLPVIRRPQMEIELEGGKKAAIGEILTDKELANELKKQRLALRSRTAPVAIDESDEPGAGGGAQHDDIPF